MGRPKNNAKQQAFIAVPAQIISSISSSSLQSLLSSSIKSSNAKKSTVYKVGSLINSPKTWFMCLFFVAFLGMLKLFVSLGPLTPSSPCNLQQRQFSIIPSELQSRENVATYAAFPLSKPCAPSLYTNVTREIEDGGGSEESKSFWKQPDGLGYRPCLRFSQEYREESLGILRGGTKYLMVVVSGGLNQQRNQIVDAVIIARILGATLVVPVFQVNVIWGDESEFSDIFDLEHFKRVLADDVRIVSSLPSTHLRTRPVEESQTPFNASPRWIRQHYLGRLRKNGVLLLRGLDSRLSKDLPADLQKLRCKVAFDALKFAPRILEIGTKLAERMQNSGPFIALHLRMEKDVWVRTGCSPGLTQDYDDLIEIERQKYPKLLTAKSNMTAHERKLAGLCPLNAVEVARLLKALGAPKSAKIYWAGGHPFGGRDALLPLTREFPQLYNKVDVALPGELEPFANKASLMAAIDYLVSEKSDVFVASHGGNMNHALQGHRAYAGHKKHITPNKRTMLPYFMNSSLPETEFNKIVKDLHKESLGQPEFRTNKPGRDVTKYPVPECMCNDSEEHSSS